MLSAESFPSSGPNGTASSRNGDSKTIESMVWAGANLGSYGMAAGAIKQLAGLAISDRRIRLQIEKIGTARIPERDAAIDELKQMTLVKPEQITTKLLVGLTFHGMHPVLRP